MWKNWQGLNHLRENSVEVENYVLKLYAKKRLRDSLESKAEMMMHCRCGFGL